MPSGASVYVTLIWIRGLFHLDSGRFPAREHRGQVFINEAEMIHDRPCRRSAGIGFPQQYVNARKLDHRERPVFHDRAAHRIREEMFLRGNFFHREMDVAKPLRPLRSAEPTVSLRVD